LIYAGCDLGILAAKVAIIEDGEILALEVLPYRNHPREAAVEVMDKALARAGLSAEKIDYCLATGFGKRAVDYADGITQSPLCLYRAVREMDYGIRTVIDVGGHSFTTFNIWEDGQMSAEPMPDWCPTATGRFIEVMADALEMSVEELIHGALESSSPVYITSQCAVYAESDVISQVNDGKDPFDIFAGIAHSMAARIAGLVRRIDVDEKVVMAGGVANNAIVVRDLEKELGLKLAELNGVNPQVLGAYGAALLAGDRKAISR